MIKILMNHKKIEINKQNAEGDTALLYAIKHNLIEAAALLINDPRVNVTLTDNKGCSPLMCAVMDNLIVAATILLAHKHVDVNQKNDQCNTPLIMATIYNNMSMVSLLLKHPNIDLDAISDTLKITALDYAKSHQKEDIVELIIKLQQHNQYKLNTKLVTSIGLFNNSKQKKLGTTIDTPSPSLTPINKISLSNSASD